MVFPPGLFVYFFSHSKWANLTAVTVFGPSFQVRQGIPPIAVQPPSQRCTGEAFCINIYPSNFCFPFLFVTQISFHCLVDEARRQELSIDISSYCHKTCVFLGVRQLDMTNWIQNAACVSLQQQSAARILFHTQWAKVYICIVCSSSILAADCPCTRAIDRFSRERQRPTRALANQNTTSYLRQSGCVSVSHA